jgi:toxin YhaV
MSSRNTSGTRKSRPRRTGLVSQFLGQTNKLRQKYPDQYRQKSLSKRRAAVIKLMIEVIPQDPERTEYRQGETLGPKYKNWFRAKFLQQYRLFFRFNKESRIIIFGWVNDETTKRAYESKTDAYRVFRKMLDSGNPPDDWDELLEASMPIPPIDL